MTIKELKLLKTSVVEINIGDESGLFQKEFSLPASTVLVLDKHSKAKQTRMLESLGDTPIGENISEEDILQNVDKALLMELMTPSKQDIDELRESLSKVITDKEIYAWLEDEEIDEDFIEIGYDIFKEELYTQVFNGYERIKEDQVKSKTPRGSRGHKSAK